MIRLPFLPTLSAAQRQVLVPPFRALLEDNLAGRRRELPSGQSTLAVPNRASFVDQAWRLMEAAAIAPPEPAAVVGDWLRDLFDTNVALRHGWRQWTAGIDPDVLEELPFQRLRTDDDAERAALLARWQVVGGKLPQGEMIAAKWDPIWQKLSAFGFPFAPFAWASWAHLEDLDRAEASALGLVVPSAIPRIAPVPPPEGLVGLVALTAPSSRAAVQAARLRDGGGRGEAAGQKAEGRCAMPGDLAPAHEPAPRLGFCPEAIHQRRYVR